MRSATDGVMRLVAYRRLGTAPLYVVAAVDRQVIVQAWLRQLAVLLAVTLPVAWLVASHARAAMRRAREEIDALNRLAEETARRQRAEVALLQSQKLEAMGRLTGGVAHDFNNLLAVVSGNVEVLKRLSPQPAQLPRLEAIARAVTSGTQLTRQLLAFARKQALQPETVRLQQRLPQLLDMLRPLIGTSIDLTLAVDEDTAPVEVDPAELELALMNAAVNASDAMAGRGRLSIRVRNAREEDLPPALPAGPDGLVLIDVDDDGPGIDPASASQVFEPFFTTKPMGQGTGLGLSQVRAFCHRSGGDALIAPAPGGGTRLRLLLQRSRSAQVPGATPDALPGRLDGARVLLVEDNAEVSQATRQLLEAMGAQVRCVPDASAALALLARRRDDVDVVLSDIQMPGPMDGIALAARLSADAVPVPVVLISGYTQRLEEAVNQNLNVLPKPVGGPRLAEALARAMGRPLQPRPA
jgi:signal transduction histidine kinase/CheY-like chemotaxis protein